MLSYSMLKKRSSIDFQAKIWLRYFSTDEEEEFVVENIDVWVFELEPLEGRSGADWVRDYLNELRIEQFLEMINGDKEPPSKDKFKPNQNYQILIEGQLEGSEDYFGEYDEDLDIFEVQHCVLPENYYEVDDSIGFRLGG